MRTRPCSIGAGFICANVYHMIFYKQALLFFKKLQTNY